MTRPYSYGLAARAWRALNDLADDDGMAALSVTDLARSLGVARQSAANAVNHLRVRDYLALVTPGHGSRRPPVWRLDRSRAPDVLLDDGLSGFAVTAEQNRAVSNRLLARLLKFHGEAPPDPSVAMAVMVLRERLRDHGRAA